MADKPEKRKDAKEQSGTVYRKRATTSFEALQVRTQEHAQEPANKSAEKVEAKHRKQKTAGVPAKTANLPTPQELRRRAKERYEQANSQLVAGEEARQPAEEAAREEETGAFVAANVRRALDVESSEKGVKGKSRVGDEAGAQKKPAKSLTEKLSETATLSETTQLALAEIRNRAMRDMPSLDGEVTTLAFNPRKQNPVPVVRGIGNLLYSLGYATEYLFLQIWRVARDGSIFFGQVFAWLFAIIFAWAVRMVRGLAQDIAAPFVNLSRRRRQLKRIRERERRQAEEGKREKARGFLGVRMRHGFQFVAYVGGILLPLLAFGMLGYIVYTVVDMDYGLAVEMNGEVIGHVTDQTVVEGAKGLLRDRIQLADGQDITDWQLSPVYTIARTNNFTNTQQLANQILLMGSKNPGDLVEATGLYINGDLYAVTDRGQELKSFLDNVLQRYKATAPAEANVDFVFDVACEPQSEDLFFVSSVENYDTLVEQLSGNVSDGQFVVVDGAESLSDIAVNNGLTLETLKLRNPEYADMEAEYAPPAGKSMMVRRAQPFLQVQTTYRETYVETVPFATEERETLERARGVSMVVQEGVDGQQQVWDDLIYIDGELQERRRVDELTTRLSEPVTRIIEIGTYEFESVGPGDGTFNNAYMWPVPDSTWGSRGQGPNHRGVDINGPIGTPIYASNAGTVVTAGWHWSYGWHVVIQHPDGMRTLYGHCVSLAVVAGDEVRQGQYIAGMGSTGNSSGSHLHLEFMDDSGNPWEYNPFNFVAPPPGWTLGYPR